MEPASILTIAMVVVVLILIFKTIRIVPQGAEWTLENFGRYSKTLRPGLHFVIPIYQSISNKVDMRERVIDIPSQEVITKDNVMVTADAVVFIQVLEAQTATYEVASLQNAIQNLCLTNVRTVVGSMDLDEVSPPHDITQAMNKQMKAEREKRSDILIAEGHKQSQILKAEGEKEAAIREAEGRKEAAYLDAEAREREAQAEAKATEMVSTAIARGDVNAVNYFVAQEYVKAFGELANSPNQKTVIVPAELSALAATVGGIGSLLEAGKDKK